MPEPSALVQLFELRVGYSPNCPSAPSTSKTKDCWITQKAKTSHAARRKGTRASLARPTESTPTSQKENTLVAPSIRWPFRVASKSGTTNAKLGVTNTLFRLD